MNAMNTKACARTENARTPSEASFALALKDSDWTNQALCVLISMNVLRIQASAILASVSTRKGDIIVFVRKDICLQRAEVSTQYF